MPRLKLVEIGRSPQNRPIFIAFISTKENLNNLVRLREINRRLAFEPDLSLEEKTDLIAQGRVFFLATPSTRILMKSPLPRQRRSLPTSL